MKKDTEVLRSLASEYTALLQKADNSEKYKLQKAINDNKMIRPVVLIDELPWAELNVNNELTLQCEDVYLKTIENQLRRKIYHFKYFAADMILQPFVPINKIVTHKGIGVAIDEEVIEQGHGNNVKSHEYKDNFEEDESLELLHNDVVSYEETKTKQQFELVNSIIGDILPAKIVGINFASVNTWDLIAELRGVTPLLIDLMDRPEFTHKLVKQLTDIRLDTLKQYEKLGLFEDEPLSLHCTSAPVSDLPTPKNGEPRKLKDVWGRGVAQIFASVGKDMHEEFDIEYMKKTMEYCGLAYYGCCEPLDTKIDIVEKIPNLRKISITPWADVNVAAEVINGKYVIASKPNPSAVAVNALDKDNLKQEIKTILKACSKNNCTVELTLKDISTTCGNPNNIIEWEKIAMGIVNNM